MKSNSKPQSAQERARSKILDSKSWIHALQHFTHYNNNPGIKLQQDNNQIQYVVASTFDCWLMIKYIDVQNICWKKLYEMKMSMPVVNSFIEFNTAFQPQGITLAYFDGSIDYSPWSRIQSNFAIQIQGGKYRSIRGKKSYPQIVEQSGRPAYINCIVDESDSVQQAFMLETVCFLHKQKEYIYSINFKGELKIFKFSQNDSNMRLINKLKFQFKVIKAQCILRPNNVDSNSILVAVCFTDLSIPFIFQLSPETSQDNIQQRTQLIIKKIEVNSDPMITSPIKLITFDPETDLILTCCQNNQIVFFEYNEENTPQKTIIHIADIQKAFFLEDKKQIQLVNDISVKDGKLVIICSNSFYLYNLKQNFILGERKKLNEKVQIGKLVTVQTQKKKPLILIKRKFDYWDPQTKKSTTLHLFTGK